MSRSMEKEIMAKFTRFRARMWQSERRINDENLLDRDNFLKLVEGNLAVGPYALGALIRDDESELDGSPPATSRKRHNKPADGTADVADPANGPVKRQKSSGSSKMEEDTRFTLFINNEPTDILEYLGSGEFLSHVDHIRDPRIIQETALEHLATFLKPWQASGQEKLSRLSKSLFRGGFLADPVGLGKSLTALVAALRVREAEEDSGFILVVCRKSCVVQWYDEIQRHFKKDHRPRVCWLTTANWDTTSLEKDWDVVICTQEFLRQRHSECINFQRNVEIVWSLDPRHNESREETIRRPFMPFPVKSCHETRKAISVVIVDESQDAKNPDSILGQAIRSLKYSTAFLLTGTPIHNRWDDLYGQISLLPGCPFQSISHFRAVFTTAGTDEMKHHPTGPHLRLLQIFMSGLMIARPKSVLKLPGLSIEEVRVDFSDHFPDLFVIFQSVKGAKINLQKARANPRKRAKYLRRAFGGFSKAQSCSANPLIYLHGKAAASQDERERVRDIFSIYLKQQNLPCDTAYSQLDEQQIDHFKRFCSKTLSRDHQDDDREDDTDLDDASSVHSDDEPMVGQDIEDQDVVEMEAIHYEEQGFRYAEEKIDQTYDPERGDVSELDDPIASGGLDSEEEDSELEAMPRKPLKGRSNQGFTKAWLEGLAQQPDDAIFSPRVATIVELIQRIRRDFPIEKILIASHAVMFLDVLGEALRRTVRSGRLSDIGIVEFNGTVDVQARAEILKQFNGTSTTPNVLLLGARAGGVGLNIAGASQIILTEPFWSPGDERQVIGRAHRMPQMKEVKVYKVFAPGSDIDEWVRSRSEEKTEVRDDASRVLVGEDRGWAFLPSLPTRDELISGNDEPESDDDTGGSEVH